MSVASLAQLVEQLIRNQQVKSSSLLAGSTEFSPHGENREGFFCWATTGLTLESKQRGSTPKTG